MRRFDTSGWVDKTKDPEFDNVLRNQLVSNGIKTFCAQMNKTAREAREESLRRHRAALDSIKKTCRTNMILGVLVSLATGFAVGYNVPRPPMDLPPVGELVVAITADRQPYVAYLDEGGEFRDFSNGMVIGQVVAWSNE